MPGAGITSSLAPWIRLTISREKRSGSTRSSSPTVTSVGARTSRRGGRRVVTDQSLGRAAERVDRLLMRARLGGVEPAVHRPVVPDPRGEAPEVDGDEEVAGSNRPCAAAQIQLRKISCRKRSPRHQVPLRTRLRTGPGARARAPGRSHRPWTSRRRAHARARARPCSAIVSAAKSAIGNGPSGCRRPPTPRLSKVVTGSGRSPGPRPDRPSRRPRRRARRRTGRRPRRRSARPRGRRRAG